MCPKGNAPNQDKSPQEEMCEGQEDSSGFSKCEYWHSERLVCKRLTCFIFFTCACLAPSVCCWPGHTACPGPPLWRSEPCADIPAEPSKFNWKLTRPRLCWRDWLRSGVEICRGPGGGRGHSRESKSGTSDLLSSLAKLCPWVPSLDKAS